MIEFFAPGVPAQQIPETFIAKIEFGSCWLWTASLDIGGYGRFRIAGKEYKAHRFIYELLVSPIGKGLVLDHLCRNRSCVHPDHLEPVSNRENILRGVGWAATNSAKTHCPAGHEYTPGNTWLQDGRRICQTCHPKPTWSTGSDTCRRGHKFTPENTKVNPDGRRRCRKCGNDRRRARREANWRAA